MAETVVSLIRDDSLSGRIVVLAGAILSSFSDVPTVLIHKLVIKFEVIHSGELQLEILFS